MTSREILTRVIEHRAAPRIGFDFLHPYYSDLIGIWGPLFSVEEGKFNQWGKYPELLRKVPDFRGEVRLDNIGNIFGRLDQTDVGECIYGVLQDDWNKLNEFQFPAFNSEYVNVLRSMNFKDSDKFVALVTPVQPFCTLSKVRRLENALMDVLLEPEQVTVFLEKVQEVLLRTVELAYEIGAQAVYILDDWGMQHAPFVSPETFRQLFKPVYKTVAEEAHERGLKMMLHSCGLIWDLIPDLIDAGIDVFQFDQPELSGSANLAENFGRQVTIYSPVDIQRIMPTGDRELIETSARHMIEVFRKYAGGSFIAKDYPQWKDIDVKDEWADWARNVFLEEGWIH